MILKPSKSSKPVRKPKSPRVTKKDSKKQKKILEDKLDKAWSLYVRNRAPKCEKCGGNGYVQAHHAFGRRHRATRWNVDNGVSLDFACHLHWAHRDPAGFTEWFRNHIGEDKYSKLALDHNSIIQYDNEALEGMLDWFFNKGVKI